jgi:tetratricopeptide (TPR) repeat protein
MTYRRSHVLPSIRLLAIAIGFLFSFAHADEYADVTQLVRAGKLADALNKADQFLTTKPRDPQMRFIKGVIQRDNGKTSEAIATFTRLTEDYPELPEPYNNLAVLYAGQSQYDKARTALEMAIRTNPSYATAHENLGDVYAKLASQAYTKALQLDTNNQAVAPKLALIRELFSPTAKGQKPTSVAATATASVAAKSPPTSVAVAPTSTPVASKPSSQTTAATVATPLAAASAPAPKSVDSAPTATPNPGSGNEVKEVEAAVRAWANAWSARDVKAYLAAYGKDFDTPGAQSRAAWEEERRQRIANKSKISVRLDNLNISVNGSKAFAKFRQDYKANGLSVSSRKTLELQKKGDQWQIIKESVGN